MCPHGYHHSGSMATPALGTRDIYIYIYLYIYYECMVDNLQFLRVLDYRSILIILKNKFTNNSVEQAVSS